MEMTEFWAKLALVAIVIVCAALGNAMYRFGVRFD
jgi:hypothetical protein